MCHERVGRAGIALAVLGLSLAAALSLPGEARAQTADPGEPPAGQTEGAASSSEVASSPHFAPGPGWTALFPGSSTGRDALNRTSPSPAAPTLVQVRPRGSVPLMAAGGTLLVAGAVVGGDAGTLLMVGGAGILAWGVYLHF